MGVDVVVREPHKGSCGDGMVGGRYTKYTHPNEYM